MVKISGFSSHIPTLFLADEPRLIQHSWFSFPALSCRQKHQALYCCVLMDSCWTKSLSATNYASSYLHKKIHEDTRIWTSNRCSETRSHSVSLADTYFPLPPTRMLGCSSAAGVGMCRHVRALATAATAVASTRLILRFHSDHGLWQDGQTGPSAVAVCRTQAPAPQEFGQATKKQMF